MNGPGFIIDPFSPPGNFDGMNFNANILIIASSHSVNSVYNRMLTPILPLIMADFGLNYAQTGLIASVYALSSSLFQLPISFLGDFTGKTRLILGLSLLFNALPAYFYGYSTTYAALLTFVFLSGLGCSAYHPAAVSMIARESPRNRGLAMGLFKAGGDFGSILTPVAMGWLAVYLASWQAAAQYFVLPGIACALVIWLRFQDVPSERKSMAKEAKSTFSELFGDKFMILMTLLSSCRVMGLRGIMTFLPLLLAEGLGLGTIEVGWVLTGYFLVGTVFAVIWGKYTDGKNETRIIIIMMATSALALAFLSRAESMIHLPGPARASGRVPQSLPEPHAHPHHRRDSREKPHERHRPHVHGERGGLGGVALPGGTHRPGGGTPGIVSLLLPALPPRHEHRLAHSRGAEKVRAGERRHLEFLKRGDLFHLFRNMGFHHQRAGIIYI